MLNYIVFFGIGFIIGYKYNKYKKEEGSLLQDKKEVYPQIKFYHLTNEIYQ